MDNIHENKMIILAGKPERLINYAVDTLIISIFSGLFSLFFIFSNSSAYYLESIQSIIFVVIYILYYFIFEIFSGKTLGKMITKTKVIRRGEGNLSFLKILTRTITRLFFLDMYSYLFGYEIGMHDLLSNTIVVKDT